MARNGGRQNFGVEVVIVAYISHVERPPEILSMAILLVRDVFVVLHGEERQMGWQMIDRKPPHTVHILVRLYPLPDE